MRVVLVAVYISLGPVPQVQMNGKNVGNKVTGKSHRKCHRK